MTAKTWGTLLTSLAAALVIGLFVSRSAAAEKVDEKLAPVLQRVGVVENRATRLEAQREEDVKRLERMDDKLDELLRRVK
jgi:chaperonin cofactor prefoldin